MEETLREQIALFRYGVIAELVFTISCSQAIIRWPGDVSLAPTEGDFMKKAKKLVLGSFALLLLLLISGPVPSLAGEAGASHGSIG